MSFGPKYAWRFSLRLAVLSSNEATSAKPRLVGGIGRRVTPVILAALAMGLIGGSATSVSSQPGPIPIDHIIVIYLENRSFDHLYGQFPGAEGLDNAGDTTIQIDVNGNPYDVLPPVLDSRT